MTSFVHTHFPTEHPGVQRAEAVAASVVRLRQGFDATKTLATLLLAASVAALFVAVEQLMATRADGYLLAAWVALWAAAFAALALLAPSAKQMLSSAYERLKARSQRAARTRAEAQYWESARRDPRIMADWQGAMSRSEP